MDLLELSQLANVIGTFLTFLTAAGTLVVLWKSLKLNERSLMLSRESKQSDVLFHCNERFSRIMELRGNADVIAKPIIYYERFWSLQLDQFTHWRNGFVDPTRFDSWLKARHRQWQDNPSLGEMTYREGYDLAVASWEAQDFKSFIHELHIHGAGVALAWLSKRESELSSIGGVLIRAD